MFRCRPSVCALALLPLLAVTGCRSGAGGDSLNSSALAHSAAVAGPVRFSSASLLKRTPRAGGSALRLTLRPERASQALPDTVAVFKAQSPHSDQLAPFIASGRPGANGTVVVQPLLPGLYMLMGLTNKNARKARPTPYEVSGVEYWQGVYAIVAVGKNETLDLGSPMVAPDGAVLQGRVVDVQGRPIAGAVVFSPDTLGKGGPSVGFGLARGETRSDRSGHFNLRRLTCDEGYVFAEKPGYHLAGILAAPGFDHARITMCRQDQRAPWAGQYVPHGPALTTKQRHALALAIADGYTEDQLLGRLEVLAELDPSLALAKARTMKHATAKDQCLKAVHVLSASDPAAALRELLTIPSADTYNMVVNLGLAVARDHPQVTRAAMTWVAKRAPKAMNLRARSYAALSRLHLALGEQVVARDLAERAVRLLPNDTSEPTAEEVAIAIAPFDLNRALTLATPTKLHSESLEHVGLALAALNQPQAALQVLTEAAGSNPTRRPAPFLLFRTAEVSPELALRLARAPHSGESVSERLAALVVTAAGAAHTSPRVALQAISLMDAEMAQPKTRQALHHGWHQPATNAYPCMAAAVIAAQCGSPDPRAMMLRALSGGRAKYSAGWDFAREAQMAVFAEMVDPELARWLLADMPKTYREVEKTAGALREPPDQVLAALPAAVMANSGWAVRAIHIMLAPPQRQAEAALYALGYYHYPYGDDTWLDWGPAR